MASAATLRGSLPLLPVSRFDFSSCKLSRSGCVWKCPGIREIAIGVRCGGSWGGRLRRRSVEHRVVRMMRGDNDVVVEEEAKEDEDEEPLLLRMGVSLVTEILRVFSNLGR